MAQRHDLHDFELEPRAREVLREIILQHIANGEPIGASGLRQVYEVVLQLRGEAGARQVQNNPKSGYTHVYGAPGLSACTILQN